MKRKKDKLDDADLFINSRRMTKEDEEVISAYIRKEKAKTQGSRTKRKRAA